MIQCLDHIGLQTADLEATLHFYCDILGFHRDTPTMRDGKPGPQFVSLPNGQSVEFFIGEKLPANASPYRHLCLVVEDMEQVIALLNQNNIAIDRGPVDVGGGKRLMWISDPDGNTIEFKKIIS